MPAGLTQPCLIMRTGLQRRQFAAVAGSPDVRTLYRKGAAGALLRPLRSQPAGQHLDRDRAPAARTDPRGQGPDEPASSPAPTSPWTASARTSRGGRSSARRSSTSVDIPFSAETKRVLQFAAEEADRLLHNYIGTEHLLLGILREERSVAASILDEKGMRLNTVREDIVQLLNEKTTLTRAKETPAAGRVQPRPDGGGHEEPARSAGRPRAWSSSASSRCCAGGPRTTPC